VSAHKQIADTLVSPTVGLAMSGGISDSTRRRLIAEGDYPPPIVLSRDRHGRSLRVAWVAREIHEWVARRIAASRESEPHAMNLGMNLADRDAPMPTRRRPRHSQADARD